eukprot:2631903-Rhodomonas_salina.1
MAACARGNAARQGHAEGVMLLKAAGLETAAVALEMLLPNATARGSRNPTHILSLPHLAHPRHPSPPSLLACGARAEEWRACLHFAAEEGQQEVAKAIMAVGGEELVRITDGESKT